MIYLHMSFILLVIILCIIYECLSAAVAGDVCV